MLKCKNCEKFNESKSVVCSFCQSELVQNGIYQLDKGVDENFVDFDAKCLDQYYSAEKNHFWFKIRNKFILANFKKFIIKSNKIIEIGAGTGAVTRYLIQNGYNVSAGDIHMRALEYAKQYGVDDLYLLDINKQQIINEFDAVCLFDVIEHIDNDSDAIKNVLESLKKNGKLFITVPAHNWLWNADDVKVGHKRRYENKQLQELLLNNGFEINYVSNFFIFIVPLLFIRKLVNKNTESNYQIKINPIVNCLLYFLSTIELFFLKFTKFSVGGSILIVASKK